ncbi:MAG: hypothetical protein E6Q67_12145 [Roseateles sp.]|nr:MAG: hypothetical protein E6Q67_12145 [Roseateles sp.]
MNLVRALTRVALLVVGALIGLGLFVLSVIVLLVLLVVGLFTGRKPDFSRVRRPQPWGRHAPQGEVVDIEAREVRDDTPGPASAPPSLR